MNNLTKNQHYIPQFYQRQWDSGKGKMYRYNKEKNRISSVSIRNSCSGEFTYEFDPSCANNYFEKAYSALETRQAQFLKKANLHFLSSSSVDLSRDVKRNLLSLSFSFFIRNPKFIYENAFLKRLALGCEVLEYGKRLPLLQEQKYLLNCICFNMGITEPFVDEFSVEIWITDSESVLFSNQTPVELESIFFPVSPRIYCVFSSNQKQALDTIYRQANVYSLYDAFCRSPEVTDVFGKNFDAISKFKECYMDYIDNHLLFANPSIFDVGGPHR